MTKWGVECKREKKIYQDGEGGDDLKHYYYYLKSQPPLPLIDNHSHTHTHVRIVNAHTHSGLHVFHFR